MRILLLWSPERYNRVKGQILFFFSALFCFAVFKTNIIRGNVFSYLHLLITSTEFSRLDKDTVTTVISVKACWAGVVAPLIYNLCTRLDELLV